nr:hypothetical protein [Tanacetum cinerariifolium]
MRLSTILLLDILLHISLIFTSNADLPGTWELLVANAGIASMHTAVTRFNTIVLLDRTNIGPTKLLQAHCHNKNIKDRVLGQGCYAHSAVLDLSTRELRPLTILTDTWCSSGQFLPDGTLLQTGGDGLGVKKVRKFVPCETTSVCDWEELDDVELVHGRWYATNQILPDGSIIIVGGRAANSIEFIPSRKVGVVDFLFLREVEDTQMDNLYPYLHLLPNGHLFVFANNRAALYDFTNNVVLKRYPILAGGPRNYPSAGSSVMLALRDGYSSVTIVVCGGAEYGAFIARSTDKPAHGSCGRIEAMKEGAVWEMEDMPFGRIMGDMVLLPTGDVMIINGAQAGTQGFEMASEPCLYPLLYRPDEPVGLRFMILNPGLVPRMYHSTANLLPDGRILIAGSNPHYFYRFNGTEFPTELRIEAFSPEYLLAEKASIRPIILELPKMISYGSGFDVVVTTELPVVGIIEINIASAPFATHSFSQGQRLVKLAVSSAIPDGLGSYRIACIAPPGGRVAPPGYYMVFAVNTGVPSVAKWVKLSNL